MSDLPDLSQTLNLNRPLIAFDLETTGQDPAMDRIVQISMIKYFPGGQEPVKKEKKVNPTTPIPEGASAVHNIYDKDVKDEPTFKQISKSLLDFMQDCDLAGYNIDTYDIPLLLEEFMRCGIDFPMEGVKVIDGMSVFMHHEKRDLTAALMFYCGERLEGAHDAEADNIGTLKVIDAQAKRYEGLDMEKIDSLRRNHGNVTFDGKIIRDEEGNYRYNFGRSKGARVQDEVGFGKWMLKQSFITMYTKKKLRAIFKELGINTI